jgi:hypothetical protein
MVTDTVLADISSPVDEVVKLTEYAAGRVDHNLAQSRARQRLVLVFVVCDQPGGRGLLTRQDCGDELIAQRSWEGELRDWQIVGEHGGSLQTDPRCLRSADPSP